MLNRHKSKPLIGTGTKQLKKAETKTGAFNGKENQIVISPNDIMNFATFKLP